MLSCLMMIMMILHSCFEVLKMFKMNHYLIPGVDSTPGKEPVSEPLIVKVEAGRRRHGWAICVAEHLFKLHHHHHHTLCNCNYLWLSGDQCKIITGSIDKEIRPCYIVADHKLVGHLPAEQVMCYLVTALIFMVLTRDATISNMLLNRSIHNGKHSICHKNLLKLGPTGECCAIRDSCEQRQ